MVQNRFKYTGDHFFIGLAYFSVFKTCTKNCIQTSLSQVYVVITTKKAILQKRKFQTLCATHKHICKKTLTHTYIFAYITHIHRHIHTHIWMCAQTRVWPYWPRYHFHTKCRWLKLKWRHFRWKRCANTHTQTLLAKEANGLCNIEDADMHSVRLFLPLPSRQ